MRTLKLLVAYDGTDFVGWQRQADGTSVQGLLEHALGLLAGEPVTVVGAGRTDAGVHATGQVAGVRLRSALAPGEVRRAVNAHLPPAIRVLRVDEADRQFHARFQAQAKTYEYRILNGPVVSPFAHRYVWHYAGPLDVARMTEAARALEGQHDFACFQSTGGGARTSVRRVFESLVTVREADSDAAALPEPSLEESRLIVYRVTGDGFLRHMVRAVVGTLVEIGRGAADVPLVSDLLAGRDRGAAGPTAPARGLCLAAVSYPDGPPEVATQR